jgi:hypothetical protein
LPFIVLSGFCFLRTSELVRRFAAEEVLKWKHILWSEDLIHVPEGVAKSTRRRQGDERFVPLSSAAKDWLKPMWAGKKEGPKEGISLPDLAALSFREAIPLNNSRVFLVGFRR